MDLIKLPLTTLKTGINYHFASKEPWQIVTITTTTVLLSIWIYDFIFQSESVTQRTKKAFFKWVKLIPYVKKQIDTKMVQVQNELEKESINRTKHFSYITTLPDNGLTSEAIMNILNQNLKVDEYDWKKGKVSGTVYYSSPKIQQLVTDVYSKTSYTNPLHPDVFPGLCKMEAEVVRISANLFNGDSKSCGTMTSGGTESILMACKALRDYALDVKGITKPEMVVPVTAHAAFDKASQYLKIHIRYIPVDPVTTQVDIKAMKRAITSNTVLLVGSAPNFPYGAIDDISAISQLGVKYNIPVHVDSCLGGFLTVFMSAAGYPVPICDFRLPGVVSISADTHKYGFTPKGSSVILYREKKYLHHQYTVTTDWPGGIYGSPTVNGSRAGGSIAVCWATMLSFGKQGYIEATREIVHTTKYIEKGLRGIGSIFVFGQPATSVIAIGSNVFHIYNLCSMLNEKGWSLNMLQFPSSIHICITHIHTQLGVADQFLSDVRSSVAEILKNPKVSADGKMAIYGTSQSIPDRSLIVEFTRYYLDSMYYTRNEESKEQT
ncbi:hypothetical protein FQA39_LY02379 [Lamprigera yunnana]|nr:hypothetical protein FQA39_LY02379 [Lamprigera yunnana]